MIASLEASVAEAKAESELEAQNALNTAAGSETVDPAVHDDSGTVVNTVVDTPATEGTPIEDQPQV